MRAAKQNNIQTVFPPVKRKKKKKKAEPFRAIFRVNGPEASKVMLGHVDGW